MNRPILMAVLVTAFATGTLLWVRRYIGAMGVRLALSTNKAVLASMTVLAPVVALLSYLCWIQSASAFEASAVALLVACLVVLAWLDAETMLLPDALTIPLIWGGLLINIDSTIVPLHEAVIGAVAGYLVPWVLDKSHLLITGRRGMGMGDMKLYSALGAWLGWAMLPGIYIVSVGFHLGLILVASLTCRRRHLWQQRLPFGPSIASAGIVASLWHWPALL